MARILVVDDDPDIQLMLATTLSAEGHDVVSCRKPERVPDLVVQNAFEAMILDLSMPERSGFEVLADLQATHLCPPTLILTASQDRSDRLRGLRGGAADFMNKPFDPEELLLRIERLIGQTDRSGEISGDLATYPAWDLLQMLERGRQSGKLHARTPGADFEADFLLGQPVRAAFGHLRGDDALLALLNVHQGSFRFSTQMKPLEPSSEQKPTPPQDLLLQAAWINDELSRLQEFLPGPDEKLSLGSKADLDQPTATDPLPEAEVFEFVRAHPGSDLETLRRLMPIASKRLELTLATLIEREWLICDVGTTTAHALGGSALSLTMRTELMVETLLGNSRERGQTSGTLQLLLLARPGVFSRLHTMLAALPTTFAEGRWASLLQQLERAQGGTCLLRGMSGQLHLHVQFLSENTLDKAVKILPLCHRLVIWLDDQVKDVESLIRRVEESPRERQGWLIAEGRTATEVEPFVASSKRWTLVQLAPRNLPRLLELMR